MNPAVRFRAQVNNRALSNLIHFQAEKYNSRRKMAMLAVSPAKDL
jgi:hypothetical protein